MAVNNYSGTNFNSSEILSLVDQYFSQESDEFSFQKASAGSMGVTYLPMDYSFRWVVKWQNCLQSEIEHLCTQLYKRAFTHLSVPQTICKMSEQLIAKMRKYFQREKILSEYVPMLIEYRDGNSLNKFYENKNLFKISREDLLKLFCYFGEVSGYDFLIANCDRFIPIGFCETLLEEHAANGGNVLIEIKAPNFGSKNAKPSLQAVHFIDNAPHFFSFFDYKERATEDISEETGYSLDDCGGLFDCEEQDNEPNIVAVELPQISVLKTGEQIREERHQDFKYFIKSYPKQIDLLTSQLLMGIKKEWKRTYPERTSEIDGFFDAQGNAEVIQLGLKEGLLKAQKNITDSIIQNIFNDLKSEASTFSTKAQIVIDFIEKNLKFAQN